MRQLTKFYIEYVALLSYEALTSWSEKSVFTILRYFEGNYNVTKIFKRKRIKGTVNKCDPQYLSI